MLYFCILVVVKFGSKVASRISLNLGLMVWLGYYPFSFLESGDDRLLSIFYVFLVNLG